MKRAAGEGPLPNRQPPFPPAQDARPPCGAAARMSRGAVGKKGNMKLVKTCQMIKVKVKSRAYPWAPTYEGAHGHVQDEAVPPALVEVREEVLRAAGRRAGGRRRQGVGPAARRPGVQCHYSKRPVWARRAAQVARHFEQGALGTGCACHKDQGGERGPKLGGREERPAPPPHPERQLHELKTN